MLEIGAGMTRFQSGSGYQKRRLLLGSFFAGRLGYMG
jgi:hypothetical protein